MPNRTSWVSWGAVLLAAVGLLTACDQKSDDAPAPAAAEPERAAAEPGVEDEAAPTAEAEAAPAAEGEEPTPTQGLMRGHFEKADEAREALIRADIATAKGAMAWLAEHPLGGVLPENLQPLQKAMQDAAGEFGKATTMREAGMALATTLIRCGACHAAAGKGPTVAVAPLPEGESLNDHMARHHWAVDRMWEGLVTNDAEAFTAAAEALAEHALDVKLLAPPPDQKDNVDKLLKHVHELGGAGKDAKDPAARAEVYGNMIATCATCHRMLGRGPEPLAAAEAPADAPAATE